MSEHRTTDSLAWRHVRDGYPEDGITVLVYVAADDEPKMYTSVRGKWQADCDISFWWGDPDPAPTHWMPLPPPPNEA